MGSYAQNTMWDPVLGKRVPRTTNNTTSAPVGSASNPVPIKSSAYAPGYNPTPSATPVSSPATQKAQTLREYASANGYDVGYDQNTGNVSLSKNGQTYAWQGTSPISGLSLKDGTNSISDLGTFEKQLGSIFKPEAAQTKVQPVQNQQMQPLDFDAIQEKLWSRVESMLPKSFASGQSSETGTFNNEGYKKALDDLRAAADPLHQLKLKQLKQAQDEAELALRAQMAGAGAYDSSEMDKRLAKLSGDYFTGVANEDAQYEANLGNLAAAVYQAGLSRDTQKESSYNQMIANLAQMYLNGTLDLTKFALDDAYRRAALGQEATNTYLSTIGEF